jgi:hypothetical protein
MGYYQGAFKGDFYAGARGDPGFFSFLGKVGKAALGVASSVIPGAGIIKGLLPAGGGGKVGGMVARAGAVIAKHPVLSAAGAAGAGMMLPSAGRAIRRGAVHEAQAMGMMRRKHRRMRVTNVKALRRSIRRCQGFAKLAKRVLHFTSPRPVRGRPIFKRRARKRI